MSDPQSDILLWIPLLPLIGAALNGFFGKRFPRGLVSFIGCASVGASFALGVWIAIKVLAAHGDLEVTLEVYSWIAIGSLDLSVSFVIDALAASAVAPEERVGREHDVAALRQFVADEPPGVVLVGPFPRVPRD